MSLTTYMFNTAVICSSVDLRTESACCHHLSILLLLFWHEEMHFSIFFFLLLWRMYRFLFMFTCIIWGCTRCLNWWRVLLVVLYTFSFLSKSFANWCVLQFFDLLRNSAPALLENYLRVCQATVVITRNWRWNSIYLLIYRIFWSLVRCCYDLSYCCTGNYSTWFRDVIWLHWVINWLVSQSKSRVAVIQKAGCVSNCPNVFYWSLFILGPEAYRLNIFRSQSVSFHWSTSSSIYLERFNQIPFISISFA